MFNFESKVRKRNWFWFLIATLVFILCYLFTVGTENRGLMDYTRVVLLGSNVNVPNFYIFFTYLPLVFFLIFLTKVILGRLKNRNANKILVFFNSFFILQVTYLTLKINWINEKNILDENTLKLWHEILHISLLIQIFLIFTLVIISWKGEKRARK